MPTQRCLGQLQYEQLAGMRVYADVGGQRVYRYRCASCGHQGTNTGKATRCSRFVRYLIRYEEPATANVQFRVKGF
jgi:hypothetical protein